MKRAITSGGQSQVGLEVLEARRLLSVSITDPAGDTFDGGLPYSDITAMNVTDGGDRLTFHLTFANASQGNHGVILLDTDGNRQTHEPGIPTEATIQFLVSILDICIVTYVGGDDSADLNCWMIGNVLNFELPKTYLPGGTASLEVAAVAVINDQSGGYDRAPNEGYIRFSNNTVHIDTEGLSLAPLSLLNDPSGDADVPTDLEGMTVSQSGEHLVVRAYYHHSIEPDDIDEIITGDVYFDLDGSILTGGRNAFEGIPTFGVDASVHYTVFPTMLGGSLSAELKVDKPADPTHTTDSELGLVWNDGWFRVVGDFIEFGIPLTLLPPITTEAVTMTVSMAPLVTNYVDVFPDNGALRLSNGAIKPTLTWSQPRWSISDPAGDAFGYDNDDLTEVAACHYDGGTILKITYTDLSYVGEAITAVRLDLDQNPATGEAVYNFAGQKVMGAEKTVLFQFYGSPPEGEPNTTAIIIEGATGDVIRNVNALVQQNLVGEWTYINIPNALFNDDGGMNVSVATIGDMVPADIAPDSSVLVVPPAAADTTPPRVVASSFNDGAAQRSRIVSLSLQFSESVQPSLTANDLVIRNAAGQTVYTGTAMSYTAGTNTARWDLSGLSLANGNYTARLASAGVTDGAGNSLDGDNNGLPGGEYVLSFFRFAGDANGDRMVDVGDLGILGFNYGKTGPNLPGDMNNDNAVDVGDLGILGFNYGNSLPAALIPAPAEPTSSAPIASAAALISPATKMSLAEPMLAVLRSVSPVKANPAPAVPKAALAIPEAVLIAPRQIEPAGLVDAFGLFELSVPLAG